MDSGRSIALVKGIQGPVAHLCLIEHLTHGIQGVESLQQTMVAPPPPSGSRLIAQRYHLRSTKVSVAAPYPILIQIDKGHQVNHHVVIDVEIALVVGEAFHRCEHATVRQMATVKANLQVLFFVDERLDAGRL